MKAFLFLTFLSLIILFTGCDNDGEVVYVLPKDYLPAYPQSLWDYSNGQRVLVANSYQAHSYQESINSPAHTATKHVPVINGNYLYEYSVYQYSTTYPLKELLSESTGSSWEVNEINNEKVFRKVVSDTDEIAISLLEESGSKDTLFTDVLTVVEYLESYGEEAWSTREYYAKGVGLVRVDVSDPAYPDVFVIQKELVNYHINN